MDFKVNRDNKVWYTTTIVAALFAVATVIVFQYDGMTARLITIGIVVAILVVCAIIAPIKLRIASTGLILFRIIGKKRFPYSEMKNIELCDLQTSPNICIFGSCGIMSYTGAFYNRRIGNFTAYIGSMFRTVLITMNNGRQYVVSCLNPDKLVEISRANLRATKNRLQK